MAETQEKVSYVTAIFGGNEVHFELRRGQRAEHFISMTLHQPGVSSPSPFRLFQSFAAGTWTPGDVRTVLALSYRGEMQFIPPPEVQRVLETGAPGDYAALATLVLRAYLYGLPKDEAGFDERQPYGPTEEAA